MQHDAIVVMPARNEAGSVGRLVRELRGNGLEVIVVDDASVDGTADRAEAEGARVLRLADRLGAWGATQCGMRMALRLGKRRVVTMDADGQHPPGTIVPLLDRHAAGGADVLIGACTSRGTLSRRMAWNMFKAVTSLNVHDLTSGLRVYGCKALKLLTRPEGSLIDYQDIGVLLMLREAGLTVAERPVSMCVRESGRSRIFRNWFAVMEYMLFTFILAVCGNRRPGKGQKT